MDNKTNLSRNIQKWIGPKTEKELENMETNNSGTAGNVSMSFTIVDLWKMEKSVRHAQIGRRWI